MRKGRISEQPTKAHGYTAQHQPEAGKLIITGLCDKIKEEIKSKMSKEINALQIVLCNRANLDAGDLFQLCYLCKTNPEFVIVQHKSDVLYVNRDHPHAAEIAKAIKQLWDIEYLDEENEKGYALLYEITQLSNCDAANLILRAWHDMRDRVHKEKMQHRADEWLATYQEPLEVEENDTDLLTALYKGASLSAVFAYGYQCGKKGQS